MGIIIRQERKSDYAQTEWVVKEAFKSTPVRSGSEYNVVKKIRTESTFNPEYSRVAVHNNQVIGHVILSQAFVHNGSTKTPVLSIGLVSVHPEKQRQGIGKQLIKDAISVGKKEGKQAVIVLGHPTYYPQLGFQRASHWGITLPFDAPDEAFFALELVPSSLEGRSGTVEYSPAFFGK